MLAEAIPRLAVRLQSTFPDARVELCDNAKLNLRFATYPAWTVEVTSTPVSDALNEEFQTIQSCLVLRFDGLQGIPESDFLHLIAAENHGLRGVTLLSEQEGARRLIRARTSFIGQKGRSRDEAENLAIDIVSLLRYARLLEDRILRSTAAGLFCYEMYHSQYIYRNRGRNRFINYARTIFQGSTERAFGETIAMLQRDHKYRAQVTGLQVAKVYPPNSTLEIILRIPEEAPIITCFAPLHSAHWSTRRTLEVISRLNATIKNGHFEIGADGTLVSFVAWKQLTNELRYFSLDALVASVHQAELLLYNEQPSATPLPAHAKNEAAIPVASTRRAA